MSFLELIKKNNVFLAPMAGVTDMPFRAICKELGCGLTYTEMVSAKGLHYGGSSARSRSLLISAENERPCAVQIFGSDPVIMAEQAAMLCENPELGVIDINMGCPAPKITGNGEGSALMKTPDLAEKVIRAVADASKLPVTVKFRKGWDEDSINAVEFAQRAEQAGAAGITIHGRTRMQFYSGKADWQIIRQAVEKVKIPVIGNGDIFCARDAKDMLEQTGCAGVMVGRGAQGNPWIFAQIRALLDKGETLPLPTADERIDMALRHAEDMVRVKGGRAVVEMRKHVTWYMSGMKGAAAVRHAVNEAGTLQQLRELLEEYRVFLRQQG